MTATIDTILLHDLVLDRALNPRQGGVDQEVVEHYAAIYKDVVWPPIWVDRATRKLIDGWHRVEAARRAGVYTVSVLWVEAREEELFALAVKANLGHGVRLSREDRYKAIHRLLRESWTPARIADVLGCSLNMVNRTEKAEDLRINLKVHNQSGYELPTETLAEVVKLSEEYHTEIAELAAEVEAAPADVRRTVRAIKKHEVETPQDIRRVMTDPEFAKLKKAGMPTLGSGDWLFTFAALADQLETAQISIAPGERDAAVALFRRLTQWAQQQLIQLGADETPAMFR